MWLLSIILVIIIYKIAKADLTEESDIKVAKIDEVSSKKKNNYVYIEDDVIETPEQPASVVSLIFASLGIIAVTFFTLFSNSSTRIERIINWISMIMTAGLTIIELVDQCTKKKQSLKNGMLKSIKTYVITWIISIILIVLVSLIVKYFGEIAIIILLLAAVFYVPETVVVIIF